MLRLAAIFEITRVLHQKCRFPRKSKLRKPFWPGSYGINLEKVNSFIRQQMRLVPLTINCALNYDVFITSGIRDIGIWEAIFITKCTRGNGSIGVKVSQKTHVTYVQAYKQSYFFLFFNLFLLCMRQKELWEAYSNHTIRRSAPLCVQCIPPIFFEVGFPFFWSVHASWDGGVSRTISGSLWPWPLT